MRRPVIRLAGLATVLGLLAVVGLLVLPVSAAGVQASVEPFGVFAPLAFVLVAAVLALSFVPGPLLSAASGILFGTWLGFGCSVASSALTAVLASLLARRAGSEAVTELSGPRALALAELARRRGFLVVVLQRLIPGVPDAPLSYAFGLIGLKVWQIGLGTVIGSAPRAFSYTALGSASVERDGRLASIALIVGIAVSLVGVVIGWLLVRRGRQKPPDRGAVAATDAAETPRRSD